MNYKLFSVASCVLIILNAVPIRGHRHSATASGGFVRPGSQRFSGKDRN